MRSASTCSISSRKTVVWRECGTMKAIVKAAQEDGAGIVPPVGKTPKSFLGRGCFSTPKW